MQSCPIDVAASSAAPAGASRAALLLAAVGAPALATTIERVVSAGGIEAWLVHEPAVPLIAIDFAFAGGAAQDPAGKAGTANLAASLLDEGAGDFDSKAFHDRLERKAIELSFSADRDNVRGSLRTLIGKSRRGVRRSAACAHRAALRCRRRRAQPRADSLAAAARHAPARPISPTSAGGRPRSPDIPTAARSTARWNRCRPSRIADLKAYTHRVLARDNLKIAVVGDIDAETVKTMLDRVFGALPAKAELTPVADAAPQGLGRRIVVNLDVPQAVIDFGGAGIARKDPDFMAAYIVNHILGGGSFSSRLYQEVREKRGLAYSVSDSLVWLDHTALFLGGTATRADRTGETLDLIEKEIHRLAEDGPTADELAKAKAYLNSSFVLNLDTSSKIASLLVQLQLDDLGIDYFSRRPEMIDAVTLDDARRVAKRLLDGGLLVTVVGQPEGVASTATTANVRSPSPGDGDMIRERFA